MEQELSKLRGLGWTVAAHNDYFMGSLLHTFWLFTSRDTKRFIKVEGYADDSLSLLSKALEEAIELCPSAYHREEAMFD